MTLIDYGIFMISSIITISMELISYRKISLSSEKIKKYNCIFTIMFSSFLITLNTYAFSPSIRVFVNFILLYLCAFIIFKENISKTFFYTLTIYIVGMIYEILLSIILSVSGINLELFDTNILLKSVFSFVNMSLLYFTFCIDNFNTMFRNLEKKVNKKIVLIIFVICLFVIILVDFRYIITVSSKLYLINILIILCLVLLIGIALYNYLRVEKEIEKTESILNFMTKYEETIDRDRINRHEMLNNLLMLKTIENKNTEEYENTLNELIKEYDKNGSIKNIHKLPTGLKGMFYYKLNNIDNLNININISKKIVDISKKINRNDYVFLCKILGIILDNAVEAALKSKKKYIGVEVFNNDNEYTIIVDNSCKDKVNVSKIKNKNYSTKGKDRGLGLYILDKILVRSNCISLTQNFDNMIFTSIIKVKIK